MLSLSAEVSNQVADQSHDHSVDGGDSPWKDVCYDSAEDRNERNRNITDHSQGFNTEICGSQSV